MFDEITATTNLSSKILEKCNAQHECNVENPGKLCVNGTYSCIPRGEIFEISENLNLKTNRKLSMFSLMSEGFKDGQTIDFQSITCSLTIDSNDQKTPQKHMQMVINELAPFELPGKYCIHIENIQEPIQCSGSQEILANHSIQPLYTINGWHWTISFTGKVADGPGIRFWISITVSPEDYHLKCNLDQGKEIFEISEKNKLQASGKLSKFSLASEGFIKGQIIDFQSITCSLTPDKNEQETKLRQMQMVIKEFSPSKLTDKYCIYMENNLEPIQCSGSTELYKSHGPFTSTHGWHWTLSFTGKVVDGPGFRFWISITVSPVDSSIYHLKCNSDQGGEVFEIPTRTDLQTSGKLSMFSLMSEGFKEGQTIDFQSITCSLTPDENVQDTQKQMQMTINEFVPFKSPAKYCIYVDTFQEPLQCSGLKDIHTTHSIRPFSKTNGWQWTIRFDGKIAVGSGVRFSISITVSPIDSTIYHLQCHSVQGSLDDNIEKKEPNETRIGYYIAAAIGVVILLSGQVICWKTRKSRTQMQSETIRPTPSAINTHGVIYSEIDDFVQPSLLPPLWPSPMNTLETRQSIPKYLQILPPLPTELDVHMTHAAPNPFDPQRQYENEFPSYLDMRGGAITTIELSARQQNQMMAGRDEGHPGYVPMTGCEPIAGSNPPAPQDAQLTAVSQSERQYMEAKPFSPRKKQHYMPLLLSYRSKKGQKKGIYQRMSLPNKNIETVDFSSKTLYNTW